MANVVDALVVTLGLDPSQFQKGQKEARAAFAKTKEEVHRSSKDIESSVDSAAKSIEAITMKFLALFGLLAGARSLKDFASQITGTDAALGRLSANLGTTPGQFSALTTAVERNGGSATAAASSFRSLSDSFEELKNTGNTGILVMLQRLQGRGGAAIDMMHGFSKALPGISENLARLRASGDVAGANWFGRQLGLDEETINFLQQGWPKVQAEIEKSKRLGVATPESVKAAQDLLTSWRELQQVAMDLGREIFTKLAPYISSAANAMEKWYEKNKAWLGQKIDSAISGIATAVSTFVSSPEFKSFVESMSSRETWQPFLDFLKEAGKEENWKDLRKLISWLVGQLKEIRDALNWIDNRLGLAPPKGPDVAPPRGDSMSLADGPYAKPNTFGGQLKKNYRNAAPTWLGGRDRSDPDDPSQRHPRPGRGRGRAASASPGEGSSAGSLTELTEQAAREAGIDPRIMHGIRAGESLHRHNNDPRGAYDIGDGNSSFGPWQLHYGGINPQMWKKGLGDDFTRETGLDARDPRTIAAQTRWVAKWLRRHSPVGTWFGYHGNRDADPRWGNSGYVPEAPHVAGHRASKYHSSRFRPGFHDATKHYPGLPGSHYHHLDRSTSNNTRNSSETHVGAIHVHTNATDAQSIAKDIKPAIERQSFVTHANYGLA